MNLTEIGWIDATCDQQEAVMLRTSKSMTPFAKRRRINRGVRARNCLMREMQLTNGNAPLQRIREPDDNQGWPGDSHAWAVELNQE